MSDETTGAGARDWGVLRGWHAKNRLGNCRACSNAWPCWAIRATDAIGAAEAETARLRERVAALEGALALHALPLADGMLCWCSGGWLEGGHGVACLQSRAALAQADETGGAR